MSKLTTSAIILALFAAGFATPAAASVNYVHHRRPERRRVERVAARPLTVTPRRRRPDPFHGPAAIVTAPIAFAGMIVGLPFRAINAVFPARGDPAVDPLVVVGAPVRIAGRIAQFPFYAVDTAFGAPTDYD